MLYNKKDFELLNRLRELEERRIQAAIKQLQMSWREVRRNDRKGFAQSHCRKTYNDRRKTKHFTFEFVVWLG